jgi:hypothetical protein
MNVPDELAMDVSREINNQMDRIVHHFGNNTNYAIEHYYGSGMIDRRLIRFDDGEAIEIKTELVETKIVVSSSPKGEFPIPTTPPGRGMTEHSSPPWTAEPYQGDQGASIAITAKDGLIIALIPPKNPGDETTSETAKREPEDIPNSLVLAAAPKMLEALEFTYFDLDMDDDGDCCWCYQPMPIEARHCANPKCRATTVRAIMAQARGE